MENLATDFIFEGSSLVCDDVLIKIFQQLKIRDVIACQHISPQFNRVAKYCYQRWTIKVNLSSSRIANYKFGCSKRRRIANVRDGTKYLLSHIGPFTKDFTINYDTFDLNEIVPISALVQHYCTALETYRVDGNIDFIEGLQIPDILGLKSLSIIGEGLNYGDDSIEQYLRKCSSKLEKLCVNGLQGESLKTVPASVHCLVLKSATYQLCFHLAQYLERNGDIIILDLELDHVTHFPEICRNLKNAVKIAITANFSISANSCRSLATLPNLEHLNLEFATLGAHEASALIEDLGKMNTLKSLSIQLDDVNEGNISMEAVRTLGLLTKLSKLKLWLVGVNEEKSYEIIKNVGNLPVLKECSLLFHDIRYYFNFLPIAEHLVNIEVLEIRMDSFSFPLARRIYRLAQLPKVTKLKIVTYDEKYRIPHADSMDIVYFGINMDLNELLLCFEEHQFLKELCLKFSASLKGKIKMMETSVNAYHRKFVRCLHF